MAEAAVHPEAPGDLAHVSATAMALADQRGWNAVSLRDIAHAAGVPLAALYRDCPSKRELLAAYSRQVDADVLADIDPEDLDEPAKDRLFEVLMARFDRLKPHRAGIRSILDCSRRDPAQALGGLVQLRRSMRAMLEAADLSASGGLRGELRLDGLCTVYLTALRAFLEDTSEDLSHTMAALDRMLQRIDRPAQILEGAERPGTALREGLGARLRESFSRRGPGHKAATPDAPPETALSEDRPD